MEFLAAFQGTGAGLSKACMGIIDERFPSYTCMQCTESTTVFCPKCFCLSAHKNHLYRISEQIGGLCDCGDASSVLMEDSCKLHCRHSENPWEFTNDQFERYFGAATLFLQWYEHNADFDLEQVLSEPLALRFISLACLFTDAQFAAQHYQDFDALYAWLVERDFAHLEESAALFQFEQCNSAFFQVILQDFHFRVLGFSIIIYSIEKNQLQNETLQMLSSQVVTEPLAMRYVSDSGAIDQLMDLCGAGDIVLCQRLCGALYNLQTLSCPEMVSGLLSRGFLPKLQAFYYCLVDEFPINTNNVCADHLWFFEQFEDYYIELIIYENLFRVADLAWIEAPGDAEKYRRYHIKRDCQEAIIIRLADISESFAFEQAVEICRALFAPERCFRAQHFIYLPNVAAHRVILSFVGRVGAGPRDLLCGLAGALNCDVQELLYRLCNTLLFSVVPLFKIAFGRFKEYEYELTAIISGAAFRNFQKFYFIAFEFLKMFLPLSAFKLNVFAEHFDGPEDVHIFVSILNSILFFPKEEDILKCFISNTAISRPNFTVSSLLQSFVEYNDLSRELLEELLEFKRGPSPLASRKAVLRTTRFVEPALCILEEDEIFNQYAQEYENSQLFERVLHNNLDQNTTELICPELLAYLAGEYTTESFSVSNRIAILRILRCSSYKSALTYKSSDIRLIPIEKLVFESDCEAIYKEPTLRERCNRLKEKCNAARAPALEISTQNKVHCEETETEASNPATCACVMCHQPLEQDNVCALLYIHCNRERTIATTCPHRYHQVCCTSLQQHCALCNHKFNVILGPERILLQIDKDDLAILDFLTPEVSKSIRFTLESYSGMFEVSNVSFLFERLGSANLETDAFVATLNELTGEQKEYIHRKIESAMETLLYYAGESIMENAISLKSWSPHFLVNPSVFPQDLADLLCQLSEIQYCAICKTETTLPHIDLIDGRILCESCANECEARWNVFQHFLAINEEYYPAPYRDIFGEVELDIQGYEKLFDLEMLEYIVFKSILGEQE